MCCSFNIGKEFDIKFGEKYYYSEFDKFSSEKEIKILKKDFEGEDYFENYNGIPVCKFSGTVLNLTQEYGTGGAPFLNYNIVKFDFLLPVESEKTENERFQFTDIYKEYPIKRDENFKKFFDEKIPQVGEDVFGVLESGNSVLKFYENEEEYLQSDTGLPFCDKIEKILETEQISENEQIEIEKNFLENNYFGIIIFLIILNLFLIFVIFWKKFGKKY